LDLAVGVIIGAAFGAVVTSLVGDIIMPPIGMVMGKVDFKDLYFALDGKVYESLDAAKKMGAPVIAYGNFHQHSSQLLIVAFAVFLLVKQVNRFSKAAVVPPGPPTTKECQFCSMTIPIKAVPVPAMHIGSQDGLNVFRDRNANL
jgi:large conductance mechanosensitive channel